MFEDFIDQYLNVGGYKAGATFNVDLYEQLTLKSVKMQRYMGRFGIVNYLAAYSDYRIPKYEILSNCLIKVSNGSIHEAECSAVENCLIRYLRHIIDCREVQRSKLRNPFIWLGVGLKTLLNLPLSILQWFGVFSDNKAKIVEESKGYKTISGIASFAAFIASLVTIVVSWNQTLDFFKQIFKK